jgi:transcriptional regulator with XRE-family HTH domain
MFSIAEVGSNIRRVRVSKALTTGELGAKAGLSQAQISRIENGQSGIRTEIILKLAEVLGVPPFRFFMTDDEWDAWRQAN